MNHLGDDTCWFGSAFGSSGRKCDLVDLSPQIYGQGIDTMSWSVCWVCLCDA